MVGPPEVGELVRLTWPENRRNRNRGQVGRVRDVDQVTRKGSRTRDRPEGEPQWIVWVMFGDRIRMPLHPEELEELI